MSRSSVKGVTGWHVTCTTEVLARHPGRVSAAPFEEEDFVDDHRFDRLTRALATGFSRRSVLRRAAGTALVAPIGAAGSAAADGKDKDKDKDRDKNKDKDRSAAPANTAAFSQGICGDLGAPCGGDGDCCGGLACLAIGAAAPRCVPSAAAGVGGTNASNNANVSNQVVTTNNQVCAGDCEQTNQQIVDTSVNQSIIAGNTDVVGRPPTYFVDLNCEFDAPAYRTICTGTGRGGDGAPPVRKITLPREGLCAIIIGEESRPERRETIRRTVPVAGDNEANAGTGGVANADASGGTVNVGDVRGENDIAIDASGGNATADASGGDGNVAIAGGGQVVEEVVEQIVEPSTVTLTLEGNVVPGKNTTYWLDTDAGRRPAVGPSLVQVADQPSDTGAIVVETFACPIGQAQGGFDWFGQCTAPSAGQQFGLYPESGGDAPLQTATANDQGRARFGNLQPGTYQVRPEGTIWCYAESDRVDANGNVLVEPEAESRVWSFVCNGPSGS
jgi:hypothetical protein